MSETYQNISQQSAWKEYAWYGCIIFCSLAAIWYLIYCYKICKPHRKITIFASSASKPLDTDLGQLVFIRTLGVVAAAFSFYISIVYSITNEMLMPSIPFGARIAVAVGAVTLLFFGIKSSINAIHNHFNDQNKVGPTHTPPELSREIKPDNSNQQNTDGK